MARILILGGGFGGISTALTLRNLRPDDEIILVDQQSHFMVGFRKTWAMLDISPLNDGMRPLVSLCRCGIDVRKGTVTKIEPEQCCAYIDGEVIKADALVVALGVRQAPEQIPGFKEYALNAFARHDLAAVQQSLREFKGGKIVMGVFGLPYQCPPAPYEIAILTKEYFLKRNVDVDITVISPKSMSLWEAGAESSNRLNARMAEFGITFLPDHKVTAVEKNAVVCEQKHLECDLAFGIPPHLAVDVIRQSQLVADDGWIHPNKYTLETNFENVYAIGDCTKIPIGETGQLPKAGLFAEKEGGVVANRIAQKLSGNAPTAMLDGHALCYVETGRGEAAVIGGDFLANPKPAIALSEMSADHFNSKHKFEQSRLESWFDGI